MNNEHLLSLAFNSAIDPMWLIRVEGPNSFRFEAINAAFTKVTGWTPEQVEGQPYQKIIPPQSHALVNEKYNEALSTWSIVDYIEESPHPSGVKYAEIRVIPIRNEGGEPLRILGIANDMTEKVYLQKRLDAERESRSRYITSAAIRGQESERAKVSRELHDNVNQVLTTVKLFIELCLEQKVEPAEFLPKCVDYLNSTISEIRSLSKRLSAPSIGHTNFKETLADLIKSICAAAQLEMEVALEPLPFSEMDNELHLSLYRVMQEQFTNIAKYAKASRIEVRLWEKNAQLYLSIQDDGVGFDPTEKSTGIGITNMQSRVDILNGRFQLTSQPGNGTRLEVQIPVIIAENVCYAEQTVLNPLPT
jgi:two-component system, NarL family, sensor kinase